MSAGRVPLRVLCVRDSDGTGLWFMAADGQLLGLPKTVRTMIDPDGGSTLTGLSPGHRYRYRLPPAPAQAKFRPVDRLALHRLALAQQQPARVRPPSLAVGGSATCFMFDAEWAAEVRADPFLSALATG